MSPTISPREIVGIDEILVIGFEGNFENYLTVYSPQHSLYRFREFESFFASFRWLERKINMSNNNLAILPKAIICDHDSLKREGFHFSKKIQSYSSLRNIPLITISRSGKIDILEGSENGIDDCYEFPVSMKDLEKRIQFLAKYKSLYFSEDGKLEEIPEYKISLPKRIFDIVFASIVLICISPILLLIGLCIAIESRGPVIYKSKRVGTGYQVFEFLKFRSMYKDADKRLKELQHLNQYKGASSNQNGSKAKSDEKGLFLKFNNDPRVTKVGRLIRKTSLDELPQLINVLKGEMSIVGNRPLPLYEAEQLTRDAWAGRFLAPAGCTGLWQISKRGKKDMSSQERIDLDIQYAKNYSFWYDVKIILKTLPALIQEENV